MPSPTPLSAKTPGETIDLGRTLSTIQQAATYVYGASKTPLRRPEFPPPQQPLSCHIETMDEFRKFLRPALSVPTMYYAKTWSDDRWVQSLNYSDAGQGHHHITITPADISGTHTDKHCSIAQGLVYYLDVALGFAPPATAKDSFDAAMVGYILCFRDGNLHCQQEYMNYAPPTLPEIDVLFKTQSLTRNAAHPKSNRMHLNKVAQEALKLAKDVHQNAEKEWVPVKDVEGLIAQFTPQLKTDDEKSYKEEATRIGKTVQLFLSKLFGTAAWQNEYKRFRNDFLSLGCSETMDATSGIRHVDCSQFGYRFNIQPYTGVRISKAAIMPPAPFRCNFAPSVQTPPQIV